MSNKKLVKQNDECRVVKRPRVQALLGLGSVALTATMVASGVVATIRADNKLDNLRSDFINNNMEYREYIARKNEEIEYNYPFGEMTFEEYMNKKAQVNNTKNAAEAIKVFGDEKINEEYDKASMQGQLGGVALSVGTLLGLASIGITSADLSLNGFMKKSVISKDEEDEDEMIK